MQINGLSLIGSSTGVQGDSSFKAIDPSTASEIEPPFYAASADETNRAADLAQNAFLHYRKKTGAERAAFLRSIADEIEALGDTLTQRAMAVKLSRMDGDGWSAGQTLQSCQRLRIGSRLIRVAETTPGSASTSSRSDV